MGMDLTRACPRGSFGRGQAAAAGQTPGLDHRRTRAPRARWRHFLIDSTSPERPTCGARWSRQGGGCLAEIEEVDRNGRVLWRWRSGDHIGLGEPPLVAKRAEQREARPARAPHFRSRPYQLDRAARGRRSGDSTRHTDALYGIQRSSGEILWKLGGSETADSLQVLGDPAHRLLGGQHDARINDDGTLSVYDNGKDRPRRPRWSSTASTPRPARRPT